MTTDYKVLQPLEYYKTFLDKKVRPDGREVLEYRKVSLNTGSIRTSDGSAIVKCGSTTIVCGIKAEIAVPESIAPDQGFIVPNVTLTPICSSLIKPGPPGEKAQATTQIISEFISNGLVIDLKELCIASGKWVWVLHCDLICLNLDGGLLDACTVGLIAALKNVSLPLVTFDLETEKLVMDSSKLFKLGVNDLVTSTFSLIESTLISDPTSEEEQLSHAVISITTDKDQVVHLSKPGGFSLSEEELENLMTHSKIKSREVIGLIHEANLI